ncbi:MAG: hypothetical protein H7338_09380 [Candidatus Sericytochromatia bacterium]|nr:hypothetical protein [Candidatus Sericytochromatia bacterium]
MRNQRRLPAAAGRALAIVMATSFGLAFAGPVMAETKPAPMPLSGTVSIAAGGLLVPAPAIAVPTVGVQSGLADTFYIADADDSDDEEGDEEVEDDEDGEEEEESDDEG